MFYFMFSNTKMVSQVEHDSTCLSGTRVSAENGDIIIYT